MLKREKEFLPPPLPFCQDLGGKATCDRICKSVCENISPRALSLFEKFKPRKKRKHAQAGKLVEKQFYFGYANIVPKKLNAINIFPLLLCRRRNLY